MVARVPADHAADHRQHPAPGRRAADPRALSAPVRLGQRRRALPLGGRMLRDRVDFLRAGVGARPAALSLDDHARPHRGLRPRVAQHFARPSAWASPAVKITEVANVDLHVGMTLADDVRARPGHLLIARGYPVTVELVERLRNFPEGYVRGAPAGDSGRAAECNDRRVAGPSAELVLAASSPRPPAARGGAHHVRTLRLGPGLDPVGPRGRGSVPALLVTAILNAACDVRVMVPLLVGGRPAVSRSPPSPTPAGSYSRQPSARLVLALTRRERPRLVLLDVASIAVGVGLMVGFSLVGPGAAASPCRCRRASCSA